MILIAIFYKYTHHEGTKDTKVHKEKYTARSGGHEICRQIHNTSAIRSKACYLEYTFPTSILEVDPHLGQLLPPHSLQ